MSETRKVNLAGYHHVEGSAPDWEGRSTLTIHGRTPGGQLLIINVSTSATALGYMGREIQKALKKHADAVAEAQRRASGEDL